MAENVYLLQMGTLETKIRLLFKSRLFSHALFWLSYVVFHATLWGSYKGEWEHAFIDQLIYLPVKIVIAYYTIYVLLPKYVLKGKWVSFSFLLVASALTGGTLYRLITFYVEYPLYYPQYLDEPVLLIFKIFKGIIQIYPVVLLATTIKILKHWYVNQQDKQILAHEKLEAELKFLKTQIHPHFLFNTLNNLYALTLKKSDQAPEMVLKLSELINYMLYECNAPKVPLDNELNFIKNYIEIERMRHGDNLDIKAMITGETAGVYVAPMIILPFLENSFKHGVNEELEKSWVYLDLSIHENVFKMSVENSKSETQRLDDHEHGIGLKNVKRRLDLLYRDDYRLDIVDGTKTFTVLMEINFRKSA